MVRDAQLEFQVVYFHARGDFLQRLLPTGQRRIVSGRIELFDGIAQMVHPDHVLRPEEAVDLPSFEPVYPLVAGVTQKLMARSVCGPGPRARLPEWIDGPLNRARDGRLAARLRACHAPQGPADLSFTHPARQRLAYDEFFAHQLTPVPCPRLAAAGQGRGSVRDRAPCSARYLESLPYAPTAAQTRAMAEISRRYGIAPADEPASARRRGRRARRWSLSWRFWSRSRRAGRA